MNKFMSLMSYQDDVWINIENTIYTLDNVHVKKDSFIFFQIESQ